MEERLTIEITPIVSGESIIHIEEHPTKRYSVVRDTLAAAYEVKHWLDKQLEREEVR